MRNFYSNYILLNINQKSTQFLGILFFLLAFNANAQYLTNSAGLNGIIFGNFTATGGDSEGRLAVTGNVNVWTGYSVGYTAYASGTAQCGNYNDGHPLIVGGNLTKGSSDIDGAYQGTLTSTAWNDNNPPAGPLYQIAPMTVNLSGGIAVNDGSGMNFANWKAYYLNLSAKLGALPNTPGVSITTPPSNLNLSTSGTGINVFNVTTAQWNGSGMSRNINAPANALVIINVHGSAINISLGAMPLTGGILERNIIINYVDATSLISTSTPHNGTVLGLNLTTATFTGGAIDGLAILSGDVIGQSGFELHYINHDEPAEGEEVTLFDGALHNAQINLLLSGVDTDNDGIADNIDLDDDNDGVLDTVECGFCLSDPFANGGFELPNMTLAPYNSTTWANVNQSNSSGWQTTASDGIIEYWYNGYADASPSIPAAQGNQFVELNGTQVSTLYQTFCLNGLSGTVNWSVKHRGRISSTTADVANVKFGATLATSSSVQTMSDNNSAWGTYSGTYTIPAGQTTLVIAFESVSSAGGDLARGNFIDDINITINQACADTDNDGIQNSLDLDSDNDGCSDANEYYNSTTADGGDGGLYGTGTPAVNANGTVAAATYTGTYTNAITIGSAGTISTQPTAQSTAVGSNATFTVASSGFTLASLYQWQVSTNNGTTWTNVTNGVPYSGATTASLVVTGVTAIMSGYLYRAVSTSSTNICGSVNSNAAKLCVIDAPTIGAITQPTCTTATGSVVLNGLPSGAWIINPGAISGTGSTYTVNNLIPATYNFTVTNAAGCTSPLSANVVITQYIDTIVPVITTCPSAATLTNISQLSSVDTSITATDNCTLSSNLLVAYADTYNSNCGIIDLTPTVICAALSTTALSLTQCAIDVKNISAKPTIGTIRVVIPKVSMVNYLSYNSSATSVTIVKPGAIVAGVQQYDSVIVPVNNADWVMTQNASFITYTSTIVIPGNGHSYIGFDFTIKSSTPIYTSQPFTATLPTGTGGDGNPANNSSDQVVTYDFSSTITSSNLTKQYQVVNTTPVIPVGCGCSSSVVTINRTYTVKDASNNSSTCTQTITINGSTSSSTSQTICASDLPYLWNGLTFNSAGTQTATLPNSNGCDEQATLILTVNSLPKTATLNITQPTCTTAGSVVLSGLPNGTWTINQSGTAVTTYSSNTSSYTITGLASGTYSFTVTNAVNCTSTATSNVVLTKPICANDDTGTTVSSTTGGTAFTNVLGNDKLNGVAVVPSEVSTSFVSSTNVGVTLSGTNVIVAPGTPGGSYTLTYRICEVANPTNCDNGIVTVIVSATLSCGPVYASAFTHSPYQNYKSLYDINGTIATLIGSSTEVFGGIAEGLDHKIYFERVGDPVVFQYDGTSTNTLAGSWTNFLSGQGVGLSGNIYYVGGDYHLYKVATTGGTTDLGALIPNSGDTIFSTLVNGDLVGDGNGRLYWYASVPTAPITNPWLGDGPSYLYQIDPIALTAKNLGNYGPNGATGAAFDASGKLITSTWSATGPGSVYSIDLGVSPTSGVNLGTVSGMIDGNAIYDLASCNMPLLNPNLSIVKTQSKSCAIIGDEIEYTLTINNVGNLASSATTLIDNIPAGTTYVANSTTLNGVAISDVSGKMPYESTSTFSHQIHTVGQPDGVVLNDLTYPIIIKFKVVVGSTGLSILNQAVLNYTTVNAGVSTVNAISSNTTTLASTPAKPTIGTIIPRNCTPFTGSVILNGLPSSGTWTVNQTGTSVATYTGTGTSYTVTGLGQGTFTFTVINAAGCTSNISDNVDIHYSCIDLMVIKNVDNHTPAIGSNIVFTITANYNTAYEIVPATGVLVTDLLPSGYSYVSSTVTAGIYNPTTGVWNIGGLATQGATETLIITATVLATGNYTNTTVITGSQDDFNNTNNTASATTIPMDPCINNPTPVIEKKAGG